MEPIENISRKNLKALADAYGGVSGVAAILGRSPSQVSQWINASVDSKSGKPRVISNSSARLIEEKCGKPQGWMDAKHDGKLIEQRSLSDSIKVNIFDAAPSMGTGALRPEMDTVLGEIDLSKEWVRRNLTVSSPRNLALLTAYGDSMQPTFSDGDMLLIDRGVTSIELDAVYVLALSDNLYVKRIQRRITDGAVIIKSDNPLYDPVVLTNGDKKGLTVLGRVVWAWNGKKL